MKNIFSKKQTGRILANHVNLLIMLIMVQTSCNDGDNQLAGNTPLTLFAQMDAPQTRATVNNTWTVGDAVQVVIDSNPAETFTAQPDGITLKSPAIYWQSATQTVTARAWYPTSWSMRADQSGNGFQEADFIFAPEVSGITLANYTTKPLTFYHKTAKVTANLLPDPAGTVTATDIAAATVRFFGYTSGSAHTSGTLIGTLTGSADGSIIPKKSGNTYTALLIPQDMAGQNFIRIRIGSQDYYYKPTGADADLKEGYFYTYNITVKKNELSVTANSGMTWTSDGNSYTPVATVDMNYEDFGTTTGITEISAPAGFGLQAYLNGLTTVGNYVVNLTGDHSFTNATVTLQSGVRVSLRGNQTITRETGGTGMFLVSGELIIRGVTLSGNGGGGSLALIEVADGGKLTLRSGSITGHTNTYAGGSGGGVRVNNGATFLMYGGIINNNHTVQGGGVSVGTGATFLMYGGTIGNNNTATSGGGGIFVGNGGTFTITGGTISGNSAAYGGGVYVGPSGTFTKSGNGNSIIEINTCSDPHGKQVYAGSSLWRDTNAGAAVRLHKSGAGTGLTTTDPSDGVETSGNWGQ